MVRTTYEKNNTRFILNSASDFLSEVTTTNLLQSGNPETYTVASGKTVNTLQSALGRLNYTFKDKYLLTASVRRDGTSRFSEKNKYAIFPSVSVGWKISSEPFMENQDFFNQLKPLGEHSSPPLRGLRGGDTGGAQWPWGREIVSVTSNLQMPRPEIADLGREALRRRVTTNRS